MAKLIQKTSYIKPGKSAGGYAKYIATREKVQKLSGRRPATAAQQQLIQQLLTDFPDSKELFEYEDYSEISFSQSQLDENSITTIDEIEFNLRVSNEDDWDAAPYVDTSFSYKPVK